MTAYEQYNKNRFSLSPFGIEKGETRSSYFCTPRGASILGWTGVDGIHFCTVSALGTTVFAVNPYADPKKHAFPVAENFEMFLRLLISCGDEAALEQAHAWTKEQYEAWQRENPITPQQSEAARALAAAYDLTPVADPHSYLQSIYNDFNFDTIPYKKDYYEWVPAEAATADREWKIYYSSCGHHGTRGERAGREISLTETFSLAGLHFQIPGVYVCSRGLVVDLIAEVPRKSVRAFHRKYGDPTDDGGFCVGIGSFLTEPERMTMEAENPFALRLRASLTVNGKTVSFDRSMGDQFVPENVLEDNVYASGQMADLLRHYRLPDDRCWLLRRLSFPWATSSRSKIRTVTLSLHCVPVQIPGEVFHADTPGQQISITHPGTGVCHTLTVTHCERGEMPASPLHGHVLPTQYCELGWTLSPDLPSADFSIRDILPNDHPRPGKHPSQRDVDDASIGIIGGADGPTVVAFAHASRRSDCPWRTSISAVTFDRQDSVAWMPVFRIASDKDIQISLSLHDDP